MANETFQRHRRNISLIERRFGLVFGVVLFVVLCSLFRLQHKGGYRFTSLLVIAYPEKLFKTPLSSEFVRTYKQLLQHSDKMNKLDDMQNNIDIGKKRTGESIAYLVERTQAIL